MHRASLIGQPFLGPLALADVARDLGKPSVFDARRRWCDDGVAQNFMRLSDSHPSSSNRPPSASVSLILGGAQNVSSYGRERMPSRISSCDSQSCVLPGVPAFNPLAAQHEDRVVRDAFHEQPVAFFGDSEVLSAWSRSRVLLGTLLGGCSDP